MMLAGLPRAVGERSGVDLTIRVIVDLLGDRPTTFMISCLDCETDVWCGWVLPRIYLNSELDPELGLGGLYG